MLTVLNEGVRHLLPAAPRLDLLGTRGVEKVYRALHIPPPSGQRLRTVALIGDIISNTLYYSCIPSTRNASWKRAFILGTGAGVATQVLAPRLGLGKEPIARSNVTRILTVAWYLAGGLATAWAAQKSR
jgi:hypothetical protein